MISITYLVYSANEKILFGKGVLDRLSILQNIANQ